MSRRSREDGFDIWKASVQKRVNKYINYSLDELVDQPYREWYDDGFDEKYVSMVVVNEYYLEVMSVFY